MTMSPTTHVPHAITGGLGMLHETEKNYHELLAQLNAREHKFVAEFLACGNATLSAKRAGYSEHTAYSIGHEILRKPEISACVQAGVDAMAARCEVDADKIVKDLAAVAFSNIAHYEIDDEGYVQLAEGAPPEAIKAIQSVRCKKRVLDDGSVVIETEYKLWDKIQALTLLGKKLRLWIDRVEQESPQDDLYRELLKSLKAGDHK